MKDEMEKFLKNKKNRKILFFVIGAIILYFLVRRKDQQAEAETGYGSLRLGPTGSGTGSYGNGGYVGNVPDNSGGGVVPPTGAITGDVIPVIMSKGLPEGMDIRITGSSKDWRITDISNPNRPAGMEVSYKVAGKMYRNIQLTNFVWQSNNPLYIEKNWIKIGAADTGPRGNGQGGDDSLSDYIGRSSYAYTNVGFVYK